MGLNDRVVDGRNIASLDWIEETARTSDSSLRAHRIALTYSKLATLLDERLHGRHAVIRCWERSETPEARYVNANWFHFALWGTLTVTQNIGSDRPPQRLNAGLFPLSLRRMLTPAVAQARASNGQQLGRALAWGQRLIYVSACVGLLRMQDPRVAPNSVVEGGNDGLTFRDDKYGRLIEALSSWDGLPSVRVHRHVAVVDDAFRWLRLAAGGDADDEDRARLILGSTVLLTVVEQDLVNPALGIVVDLVPTRIARALERRTSRWAQRHQQIPAQLSELALSLRYPDQRRFANGLWARMMTDQVLVMALPSETLRLGRDIPRLRQGTAYYPPELDNLGPYDAPPEAQPVKQAVAEVSRLVASLDRTAGAGRGSAARDWRRWDERMNWGVTLFRSRQHDRTLFWPPYSHDDQCRIVNGQLPVRPADPSSLDVIAPLDGSVFGDVTSPDLEG